MKHFDTFEIIADRQRLSTAPWDDEKQRYDISNCKTLRLKIRVAVHQKQNGKHAIEVLNGAVTGYESFYLRDILDDPRNDDADGISWCAGTPGRWDSLKTPKEEYAALLKCLRDLGYDKKP